MTIIPENLEIHKPDKNLKEQMDRVEVEEKVLFEKESCFHNISIVKNKAGVFLKYLDTYQAGVFDTKSYKGNLPYINYFLIPYLMNKNIKNILVVGFGSGIIVNQYEKLFDNLKNIDIVDIEENIFSLAQKYFNFQPSGKMSFYLQDALVYLKTIKKKYDLIVVDVANNLGIDERFFSSEYLNLIKAHLKKGGVFVSNMPSSRDIFNKKNKLILDLIEKYRGVFSSLKLFCGETSNKIYYKEFFNIEKSVLDITNLIIISSDKDYKISKDCSKINDLNIDIEPYLDDLLFL